MQPSWNCELLKQNDPNDFDSIGNQFIMELQKNIKEISQLFLELQFAQALNYITDVICQSKKVFAISLDQTTTKFKSFIDGYMEVNEGIIQQKKDFSIEQQRQVVEKFLEVIQISICTINDWYKFKQQVPQKDLFQQEINELQDSFNLFQGRDSCKCQLI
ncbi:unnamed protein product [Paramecium sonneborni]|uniref:Uncharacterized protein n=1 Tax=Paramecium sonneborni TaxID=65129 RepID=A0A8S1MVJ9_9CILI|nr:unnamed protein product [Paramecium sonneborni]